MALVGNIIGFGIKFKLGGLWQCLRAWPQCQFLWGRYLYIWPTWWKFPSNRKQCLISRVEDGKYYCSYVCQIINLETSALFQRHMLTKSLSNSNFFGSSVPQRYTDKLLVHYRRLVTYNADWPCYILLVREHSFGASLVQNKHAWAP